VGKSYYKQAMSFLEALVNYEKQRDRFKLASLKLQRLRQLLKTLKLSPSSLCLVQIAGTKGKGSVAIFLASILSAHHLKVGLFTSPHLSSWRERIRIVYYRKGEIKNSYISPGDISEFWHRYSQAVMSFYYSSRGRGLSFFELITALGFYYFQKKKVNLAVLETGLGGKLDATNVSPQNELAVITPIDYDHEEILGHTLISIAQAKAGIIKEGGAVLTNQHHTAALEVIRQISIARKAPLYIQGQDFYPSRVQISPQQSRFWFSFNKEKCGPFSLKQRGDYQVENAALALGAAKVFLHRHKRKFSSGAAKIALEKLALPGRWEIVKRKPLVILDIAHNSFSLERLFHNLECYYHRQFIVIFALARDKKVGKIKQLLKEAKAVIFPHLAHMRLLTPSELKRRLEIKKAIITSNLSEAIKQAFGLAGRDGLLLITGSTYLVAEARVLLCKRNTI